MRAESTASVGGPTQQARAGQGLALLSCPLDRVALGQVLDSDEQPGPDALQAGEAAPDAPPDDGEEEHQAGAGDQQAGQQRQVIPGQPNAKEDDAALLNENSNQGWPSNCIHTRPKNRAISGQLVRRRRFCKRPLVSRT